MKLYIRALWLLAVTIAAIQIANVVAAPQWTSSFVAPYLGPQDSRIINGTRASLNNTKHQVSIRRRFYDNNFYGSGHICGGSLISENVVLSASHCFIDHRLNNGSYLADEAFIVVMGNLERFAKNNNTLVYDIKKIVKYHDVFNVTTHDQNLVLLVLNGSVPVDHPTVRPIALNTKTPVGGTVCQVTGWGDTEKGFSPNALLTVDVPIITYGDCRNQSAYGTSIHEGMLCAGYRRDQSDFCDDDIGGPLLCNGLQSGIVSWGNGCDVAKEPGVYTDVAFYKDWILSKVADHNGTLPLFV